MSDELISKKDLLDVTGISYGQLYRWKRKNLIPEDWFIRKSTFTGQETFFPKQKILERIDKIQGMKDNLSLDELAEMFSPSVTDFIMSKDLLMERNIVSEMVVRFYEEKAGILQDYPFRKILHLFILDNLLQSGDINLDEGLMLIQLFNEYISPSESVDRKLIIIRKFGISSCLIAATDSIVQFEKGTKVITEISINEFIEELKTKLV